MAGCFFAPPLSRLARIPGVEKQEKVQVRRKGHDPASSRNGRARLEKEREDGAGGWRGRRGTPQGERRGGGRRRRERKKEKRAAVVKESDPRALEHTVQAALSGKGTSCSQISRVIGEERGRSVSQASGGEGGGRTETLVFGMLNKWTEEGRAKIRLCSRTWRPRRRSLRAKLFVIKEGNGKGG